jgi:hypothetical protein
LQPRGEFISDQGEGEKTCHLGAFYIKILPTGTFHGKITGWFVVITQGKIWFNSSGQLLMGLRPTRKA